MSTTSSKFAVLVTTWLLGATAAQAGAQMNHAPKNPDAAPQASIDRFSAAAGHLQVRTSDNGLPGPNQPVDFDSGPFITQGLAPDGTPVRYYNFDVQSTTPAPIYVLFRAGDDTPVEGQLNIVDVIPGDPGYNDFWQVVRVNVPREYVANTITSLAEIKEAGFPMHSTNMLVNCPIVPRGSTARQRLAGENSELTRGWYKGQVVFYFSFFERVLQTTQSGMVPVSPIYVTFKVNPDQPGGGPPSGFLTERGSQQTHNVVETVPSNPGYSPLWFVSVYDNAAFTKVEDLASVRREKILAPGVANVNCPIVWIGRKG
jgi:hypothetical protein